MDKLLVGILVLDRPETTRTCIQKLLGTTNMYDVQLQIVIVDNNSNEATKRILDEFDMCFYQRITYNHNYGTAFGVNTYLQFRQPGQHVLNVNCDAHMLVEDWHNSMLKVIALEDIGTVSGRRPTLWYDDAYRINLMRNHLAFAMLDDIFIEWPITNEIIFPWTMMKGSVLDVLGSMNESTCIDDMDFIQRVTALGLKNVYLPDVVILQPQNEVQNHPEYLANRELIMQNMEQFKIDSETYAHKIGLYKGNRFVGGSITDPDYQKSSDKNWQWFETYLEKKNASNRPN